MSWVQSLVARCVQARAGGQSIPLIALMLVVLIGMVGLSVDVGNTYAEQRKVVSAANAAAIAGMNTYIRGGNLSDGEVYDAISGSLRSNGVNVDDQPGQIGLEAYYWVKGGEEGDMRHSSCQIGLCGYVPNNVSFVEVQLDGLVDTFFARVVGQDTLPINAGSYAGVCPPTSSVYPLAVNNQVLDGNHFDDDGAAPNEFGVISSGNLRGLTWRRLYLHSSNLPGDFAWLRWTQEPNINAALRASMIAPGNLSQGFVEAEWPGNSMAELPGYPKEPGQLNADDWVRGISEPRPDMHLGLGSPIPGHIQDGTVMILPIYNGDMALGSDYLITGFGAFIMQAYNENPDGQPYVDLVYAGEPINFTACTTAPVEQETLSVAGTVEFWPEYSSIPQSQLPIQYVVVLDVSGSMNFDFWGQGSQGSNDYQCGNSPDSTVNAQRDPNACEPNYNYAWKNEQERRIYIAKDAIKLLIDLMHMPGNPNYDDVNRPSDQMSLIAFHDQALKPSPWSNDPETLKQFVDEAGAYDNDPYVTDDRGTNGAAALYQASRLLGSPLNDVDYRPVVIFVTDGVSNFFFDEHNPDNGYGGVRSDWGTYPDDHTCKEDDFLLENAACMINNDHNGVPAYERTMPGGETRVFNRPITAMEEVSATYLHQAGIQVYVVALSKISKTGLQGAVATDADHYREATILIEQGPENNVDAIFRAIYTQIEGDCVVNEVGSEWVDWIEEENSSDLLIYPTVGEVFLYDSTGAFVDKADIVANQDANNGERKLSFSFSNLPEGTYTVDAYVWYTHVVDNATRQYKIYEGTSLIVESGQSLTGVVQHHIRLKMDGSACMVGG
jgi:hypothetical protein